MRPELADMVRALEPIAAKAGELLRAGYRTRPRPESKSAEADLVTEFDRRSEELVFRELAEALPGIPIVGEEETGHLGRTERQAGLVFYVDPLDGTTNFVHGAPTFSVSIGAFLDDAPVLGVVHAPVLGITWSGHVGGVVTRNGVVSRVSPAVRLAESLVATGFPPRCDGPPHDNFDSFMRVQRVVRGVRRCGSAAVDLAMVADGTYEAYWERNLRPWDLCGGSALVLAAGGDVTSLDGSPPDYHAGTVVASNARVHAELVGLL